jgi:hypothetical protein
VEVPVQFFQSVIAIELAVAGALLWQIRYFEPTSSLWFSTSSWSPAFSFCSTSSKCAPL